MMFDVNIMVPELIWRLVQVVPQRSNKLLGVLVCCKPIDDCKYLMLNSFKISNIE
jgi:hypothetical protein